MRLIIRLKLVTVPPFSVGLYIARLHLLFINERKDVAAMTQHSNLRTATLSLKRHLKRVLRRRCVAEAESFGILACYARRDHDAVCAVNDLRHIRKYGRAHYVLYLVRLNHPYYFSVWAITYLKSIRMIRGYALRVWRDDYERASISHSHRA